MAPPVVGVVTAASPYGQLAGLAQAAETLAAWHRVVLPRTVLAGAIAALV